ncbi:unnamed protein product [Phytophthora fragariaefolia]|uniref:Unnamed protein product n=1 Tax=Phytophthora fragariaefolia TaxID=1490495 RepID=A0A9W6X3X5_9STRA|nr:unnamed protein product [Phytophthora fragariaefolia]
MVHDVAVGTRRNQNVLCPRDIQGLAKSRELLRTSRDANGQARWSDSRGHETRLADLNFLKAIFSISPDIPTMNMVIPIGNNHPNWCSACLSAMRIKKNHAAVSTASCVDSESVS